jgi:hypothetical protein
MKKSVFLNEILKFLPSFSPYAIKGQQQNFGLREAGADPSNIPVIVYALLFVYKADKVEEKSKIMSEIVSVEFISFFPSVH